MPARNLQPISPEEALQHYLRSREGELAQRSLPAHQYRLKHFIRWTWENDIDNLNPLTGRDLEAYKNWRRKDGDLNLTSLKTQMDTLKVFTRYLENINGVKVGLSDKITSHTVGKSDRKDEKPEADHAQEILNYLSKHEYASLQHTLSSLMWSTGARLGTLRAFDVPDFDSENKSLQAKHRPEKGTALKISMRERG